jgi:hypothetical protein
MNLPNEINHLHTTHGWSSTIWGISPAKFGQMPQLTFQSMKAPFLISREPKKIKDLAGLCKLSVGGMVYADPGTPCQKN